jgi:hypothetical protein
MKFPVFGRTYRNYGIINSFLADIQSLLPKAMPDAHYTADTLKPLFLLVWCGVGVPLSIIVEFLVWILVSLLILFCGRCEASCERSECLHARYASGQCPGDCPEPM